MSITMRPSDTNVNATSAAHHAHDAEDSSFSHPKVQALVDRGVRLAVGYGALGSAGKWTTRGEIDMLASAGIAYIGGGELGSTSWRGGAATGHLHAAQLNAYYSALGYPRDVAIPVAFDSHIAGADLALAIAYGNAVADDLHFPFGIYGAIPIINALGHRSSFNWLTAASSWNDGQRLLDHIPLHLLQGGGDATIGIDWDVIASPFRAWLGTRSDAITVPTTRPSTPPFTLEEDAMLYYTDDNNGIWLLAGGYMQHLPNPEDAEHYAKSGIPVVGTPADGITAGELARLLSIYPTGPAATPTPTVPPADAATPPLPAAA